MHAPFKIAGAEKAPLSLVSLPFLNFLIHTQPHLPSALLFSARPQYLLPATDGSTFSWQKKQQDRFPGLFYLPAPHSAPPFRRLHRRVCTRLWDPIPEKHDMWLQDSSTLFTLGNREAQARVSQLHVAIRTKQWHRLRTRQSKTEEQPRQILA